MAKILGTGTGLYQGFYMSFRFLRGTTATQQNKVKSSGKALPSLSFSAYEIKAMSALYC